MFIIQRKNKLTGNNVLFIAFGRGLKSPKIRKFTSVINLYHYE